MQQQTPEWFAARLGKVTASRIADVIARTKSGYSASRENYATELALERIMGYSQPGYTSPAMQWGIATEPEARAAYEMARGEMVAGCGLIDHPTIEMSGASPDGLIGSDGLLEIKCPESKQHLEYLRLSTAPAKYKPQIQWQLACTGRAWCDFVSYDPRFPEPLRLHIVRVDRDAEYIASVELEVVEFLKQVAAVVAEIERIGNGKKI